MAIKTSATKIIPANSIAIITRVGVGKLAFIQFKYATSQDFLSLSSLKIDGIFGAFLIAEKIHKEVKNVQGTSIKGVTKNEILQKTLRLPSLTEQSKIGAFFKGLDELIALHQRKYESTQND